MRTEEQKAKHRLAQRRYAQKYPERVKASLEKYRKSLKAKPRNREINNRYRRNANAKSYERCDKNLHGTRWRYDEVIYLIENYQNKTISELAIETGRTISAIERKRNKLGLKKEKSNEEKD